MKVYEPITTTITTSHNQKKVEQMFDIGSNTRLILEHESIKSGRKYICTESERLLDLSTGKYTSEHKRDIPTKQFNKIFKGALVDKHITYDKKMTCGISLVRMIHHV